MELEEVVRTLESLLEEVNQVIGEGEEKYGRPMPSTGL